MALGVASGLPTLELAKDLSAIGFKPYEVEGDILYFKKKIRVAVLEGTYWICKGKKEPVDFPTFHGLVETLTTLGA